jgi:hypothetical protein
MMRLWEKLMGQGRSASCQRSARHAAAARPTSTRKVRLRVEALEDRLTPSTYTVTSTGDTGAGSGLSGDLRYCITQANSNGGANTIQFDSTVFSTPQTITLTSLLPTITDNNLTITGPGAGLATISGNGQFQVMNITGVNDTITGLTIANGSGGTAGGIYLNGSGSLALVNMVISQNSASVDGGGIGDTAGTTLTISNSTISNNSGKYVGGLWNNGTANLTDCTLSGNSTAQDGTSLLGSLENGGAIQNNSTLTMTDCTLFGNFANHDGGGIYNKGTATLTNCTVDGNSVKTGYGGGLADDVSTATLNNTLIAGNTAPHDPDVLGSVASSSGYNLIGNGTGMAGITNGTGGNQVGTSASPLNPMLATLGNYGGRTLTMAPLPGSPALGAGSVALDGGTITDQRGSARVVNGTVDIGAVESQATGSFSISAPASSAAGNTFNITVSALNSSGQVNTGYTGTVTLASSDPLAVLHPTYTFTPADQGVHTFTVTLKTAGAQTIGVPDASSGSATVSVAPAAVSKLVITAPILSTPASVGRNTPFSLTVTAEDPYGNVVTGYLGTVHFSSTDSQATLPANYTFTASDNGVHTFNNLIMKKRGTQTITATDTQNGSILGTFTLNVV